MDWLTDASNSLHSQPFSLEAFPEGIWYAYSGHKSSSTILWVWLHGWGQSHQAFIPLIQQCEDKGDHLVLDFPGFGHSPLPDTVWGTEDYAFHLHPLLSRLAQNYQKVIFVGHSFGCRVSLQYVNQHPDRVSAMVFIGGAGLKKQLSFQQSLRRWLIRTGLNAAKRLDAIFPTKYAQWMRQRFGSPDYKNAGPLRPILSRVVNEDLSSLAQNMPVPTLLIYGELDNQTPPEFGKRYHQLMANSTLHILSGFDHYTLLTHAKYQVSQLIFDWLTSLHAK